MTIPTAAEPAEPRYSERITCDRDAIICDGRVLTVSEVVDRLNAAIAPPAPDDIVALVDAYSEAEWQAGNSNGRGELLANVRKAEENSTAARVALLAVIGRMGRGTPIELTNQDVFNGLHIERLVREWFSTPLAASVDPRLVDGLIDVLRMRLRRAAPPPPPARDLTLEEWWQDHLDKNDRNSPEEYPDMVLVTFEEMADALATCSARSSRQSASPAPAHVPESEGHPAPECQDSRDTLGRVVRTAWVKWANTQPNPKPTWLTSFDDLSEPDKEADRQIGEAVQYAILTTTPTEPSSEASAQPRGLDPVVPLADAMWQLLDDMGADGLSVCPAAKAAARLAYEPFADVDAPLAYTVADARAVALSSTATEPSPDALLGFPCKGGGVNDLIYCKKCGLEWEYAKTDRPACPKVDASRDAAKALAATNPDAPQENTRDKDLWEIERVIHLLGFRLVPFASAQPNTEIAKTVVTGVMRQVGLEALRTDNVRDSSEEGRCERIFRAMLAVAPAPSSEGSV